MTLTCTGRRGGRSGRNFLGPRGYLKALLADPANPRLSLDEFLPSDEGVLLPIKDSSDSGEQLRIGSSNIRPDYCIHDPIIMKFGHLWMRGYELPDYTT